jgi:hypothetical protein
VKFGAEQVNGNILIGGGMNFPSFSSYEMVFFNNSSTKTDRALVHQILY